VLARHTRPLTTGIAANPAPGDRIWHHDRTSRPGKPAADRGAERPENWPRAAHLLAFQVPPGGNDRLGTAVMRTTCNEAARNSSGDGSRRGWRVRSPGGLIAHT